MVADTVGARQRQALRDVAGTLVAAGDEGEEAVLRERELGAGTFEHPGQPRQGEDVAVDDGIAVRPPCKHT